MFKPARRILFSLPLLLAAAGQVPAVATPPGSANVDELVFRLLQVDETPRFSSYKGVSIDMPLEKVRETLGRPKEPSDTMDYYEPSDNEVIQVYYEGKKVSGIMIMFTGKLNTAPDAKTVFGVAPEAKPDGGIFKMVRYPKAGFWVSYNKMVGSDPMITIAIKKI